MEMQTTEPKPYRCRCGYEWFPRRPGDHPRVCPKCKSPNWDKPYKFHRTSGQDEETGVVRDAGLQKQMYMGTTLFEEASAANNKGRHQS